ncbi:carrier protein [Thecamonas trahens ATCC 50062]|uniref:Carrier protein n=1 Tax=Thecamonas trahens ATCC 50062 TaxID=461836 RepID=A0A0L0D9T3_THETB|nr:carrier protein [Thecamonas trahens ATCC 50062]KNC49084.1 carrier protein [Thecamonas trahens ATCC 50062]|eukprot:XP_013758115.1 carrier protein [Thecamonas trahens ATCC 50062]
MDSSSVAIGLAFGGIASCVAECCTIPIDVVKTRLQLQGELGATRAYTGVFDAVRTMARKEGIKALFGGLSPALLRQATYGSMRYGLYTPMKTLLGIPPDMPKDQMPLTLKVVAGAGAGALSSAICNPADLIKVRMQAAGMAGDAVKTRYTSLLHAFTHIIRNEGVLALWSGVGPTCARATVLAAAELPAYDELKYFIQKHRLLGSHSDNGLPLHAVTATGAGFVSALASSPFDVAKSRMLNQPRDPATGKGKLYKSMIDCFIKSVKAEGVLCLWNGFWPNFARIGPRVIIIFIVMEQLKKRFDPEPIDDEPE